ncbi:hypothetical protein H6P81_020319 [Aristolochia fimbriata]|uniref:Germin-like protein n=1 Tax=Aristolochia fimbriata TaxID=158543 RepID=A0AAV7DVZ6_ARIFI|nr:hypothetical protein H6P81_020319 [Aristolochia fimbriata]
MRTWDLFGDAVNTEIQDATKANDDCKCVKDIYGDRDKIRNRLHWIYMVELSVEKKHYVSPMLAKKKKMASFGVILLLSAVTLMFCFFSPTRSDPDSLQDFCVADLSSKVAVNGFPCKPNSAVTSDDFYFAGLAKEGNVSANPFGAAVTLGSVATFPGLNTLGIAMNRVDFAPGGISMPHTHPRATEMVFVLKGRLLVGFVSSANVLYSKVVKPGELFVIPMGLIHFQQNLGKGKAQAVTVFNSQNGGAVLLSPGLFGAKPGIPSSVLAKAFRVDEKLVNDIKSKFGA